MDDLRALYQEMILHHSKKPKNFGRLEGATHTAQGHNPLCGDQLVLDLIVDADGKVVDVRFEGQGCAISTASASLMTAGVKGHTADEAHEPLHDPQVIQHRHQGSKENYDRQDIDGKAETDDFNIGQRAKHHIDASLGKTDNRQHPVAHGINGRATPGGIKDEGRDRRLQTQGRANHA